MFICQGYQFDTVAAAIKYAASQIYISDAEKRVAAQKLESGKHITFTYGFSQLPVYVARSES